MRFALRCGIFALIAASAVHAFPAAAQKTDSAEKIEITAREVAGFDKRDPKPARFGELEFVGGLVLQSKFKHFGGISGLHILSDGASFVAHSDRAFWLRGKFRFDGNRIIGIEQAEMAPMRGPDGRTLASRKWFDTESIAADGDTLYIGIERANQVLRYRLSEGMTARGIPIPAPSGIRRLPFNQGLEALAFVPRSMPLGGALLAISERGLDENGNIIAFIIGGGTPGTFAVKRTDQFEISDAAISPSGHLVILERYYRFLTGIHMLIRAIPLSEIRPGALVEGKVLIEADSNFEIDNMEALAITKGANGEILLTLMSDNNFNFFQRSMLLRFVWRQ
ncbi:MAG: esterase-like activity of phytase family protein [Xanthobacteraceae bacterium]|nr:esterase-like activity of phytase family protein [Xanthobacteraceae bacterium]